VSVIKPFITLSVEDYATSCVFVSVGCHSEFLAWWPLEKIRIFTLRRLVPAI